MALRIETSSVMSSRLSKIRVKYINIHNAFILAILILLCSNYNRRGSTIFEKGACKANDYLLEHMWLHFPYIFNVIFFGERGSPLAPPPADPILDYNIVLCLNYQQLCAWVWSFLSQDIKTCFTRQMTSVNSSVTTGGWGVQPSLPSHITAVFPAANTRAER